MVIGWTGRLSLDGADWTSGTFEEIMDLTCTSISESVSGHDSIFE